MTVWAVVVAAGTGERFGGPKQFALLDGRPVVDRSVAAARTVADGVVLVLPEIEPAGPWGADIVTAGGPTRSDSVRRGLLAVPPEAELIVVHDGARPLASEALFRAVVDAVRAGADGAIPALPVPDTLKRVAPDGETVEATVPRTGLVAVQTPQAFRATVLRAAHAGGGEATDDAGLVEALGATVRLVPGDPRNLKLTTPDDLFVASALLGA